MCHSLAPSREMDLGRAGGFDNWAGGRKAQKKGKDRTHVLAVQHKQPLRRQEGKTEGQRKHVIYQVYSGSCDVSTLGSAPVRQPQ